MASSEQVLEPSKCLGLGCEGLHPGVRGGSKYRDAVAESGFGIAGSDAAADIRRASGQNARFRRVRAAGAKIDHGAAAGYLHDAGRFGGDQRLKADGGEQVGFRDLRFDQRRANRQEGFIGENGRAFSHGENVAGETELAQGVEETARKRAGIGAVREGNRFLRRRT